MGPSPHVWFCAFKTATLKTELQVCTGPSPHLWFCAFKTVNEAPQLTSLWVPDLACGFVNANSVLITRITSLRDPALT